VLANRYHPLQTRAVFFLVAALALLPVTLAHGFAALLLSAMGIIFVGDTGGAAD
jgi:hypothetical protein